MEVAQIGRGIVYQLLALYAYSSDMGIVDSLPTPALIETIGFGHDLGHPPFGHSGEIALNYMMRNAGGFEGNGQSLRILARLELHTETYEGKFGLDLSRRALLGILKYPAPFSKVNRGPFAPPVSKFSQLRANLWKPPKCYLDTERDMVEE